MSETRKTTKGSQSALKYVQVYKVPIAVQDLVPLCPRGTKKAVFGVGFRKGQQDALTDLALTVEKMSDCEET